MKQGTGNPVDKTHFIREWWESNDSATLLTRPRRFGKTLNFSERIRIFNEKALENYRPYDTVGIPLYMEHIMTVHHQMDIL